jgi:hypothetical protein
MPTEKAKVQEYLNRYQNLTPDILFCALLTTGTGLVGKAATEQDEAATEKDKAAEEKAKVAVKKHKEEQDKAADTSYNKWKLRLKSTLDREFGELLNDPTIKVLLDTAAPAGNRVPCERVMIGTRKVTIIYMQIKAPDDYVAILFVTEDSGSQALLLKEAFTMVVTIQELVAKADNFWFQ